MTTDCPLTRDDLHDAMACFRKALELPRSARASRRGGYECSYCFRQAEWPSQIAHADRCHVPRMRRLLAKLVAELEGGMRLNPSPINEPEA